MSRQFPLIKLAKKLKADTTRTRTREVILSLAFPLIKLAKKLKGFLDKGESLSDSEPFPLIKLAKKLKDYVSQKEFERIYVRIIAFH